jgi:hypothetical protein
MSCTTCGGTPQIAVDTFGSHPTGSYVDEHGNPIESPTTAGGWLDEVLKPGCNICVRCLLFWSGVAVLALLVISRIRK